MTLMTNKHSETTRKKSTNPYNNLLELRFVKFSSGMLDKSHKGKLCDF